jgi:hypothetical protein
MAISTPVKTQINVVATTFDHSAKSNLGQIRTGSYLSQASMLVYDDILRFQNSTPKNDIINTLTPKQKKAVYAGIKTIYQPMYGVSGSPYYDETYFNLLKGYVGSYFYKEYDWFNTNDTLNIFEFAALNLGNALYQFIDAVWTDETIREAYNDYAEQGMGVYRAWQEQGNDSTYFVRDELKDKRIKVNLWDDSGSGETGIVVYAGFDAKGELVVWDSASYPSIGTTADISRFNYNEFEGNILWFMDELVGMESDWIQNASPGIEGNTAYGYVQFTEDSVETAVNRYIGHLERFNERSADRGWEPYSIKKDEILPTPEWLTTLKNSTKTHEEKLDALTYDEMLALAFVHLHSKDSKDSNFVLLSRGDIYASKELYKNNHHTNPDEATLTRLESFFPWRKQNIYEAAFAVITTEIWMKKSCGSPQDVQIKTADDVINILSSKLNILSGDDLFNDFQNQAGVTVTSVTQQVHPLWMSAGTYRPYTDWHTDLTNPPGIAIPGNTVNLKAFKRVNYSGDIGYYYYRENGDTIWLQNFKDELNNNAALYDFDELYNTIDNWNLRVNTYLIDWWIYNIRGTSVYQRGTSVNGWFDFITPNNPYGFAHAFGISNGFNWYNTTIHPNGICVIGMSTQPSTRGQFATMFHEAGGHAIHNNLADGWAGGTVPGPAGISNEILLSDSQTRALLTLYQNYKADEDAKIAAITGGVTTAYRDRVFDHLPMGNIRALGLYSAIPEPGETAEEAIARKEIEEEFLARIYSIMATNKCITFKDDIWPVMKGVSPDIANIIDIDMATAIDQLMLNEMGLNKRGIV